MKTPKEVHEWIDKDCAKTHERQFRKLYRKEIKFIEDTEIFFCRINHILGRFPPLNEADESIRDLFADMYDSFTTAKKMILQGYLNPPFSLMRRAFETMLLIRYFHFLPDKERKWRKGGKKGEIKPEKTLSIGRGDEKFLKAAYNYYSRGTHINSKYVWPRQLGKSFKFTLGNFFLNPNVSPYSMITREYIMRLIQLIALAKYIIYLRYEPILLSFDSTLAKAEKKISDDAANVLIVRLNSDLEAKKAEQRKIQGL